MKVINCNKYKKNMAVWKIFILYHYEYRFIKIIRNYKNNTKNMEVIIETGKFNPVKLKLLISL